MFAPLFKCPKCGEVWRVSIQEECEYEYDEIYEIAMCEQCGSTDLTPIKDEKGKPVVHLLTDDEVSDEMGPCMYPDEFDY